MHAEITNHKNAHKSIIKESYLFERSDKFIDRKINALNDKTIYLDFTPDYIFNPIAMEKIANRNINCFFIIRDYSSWRISLQNYLKINDIHNESLIRISESHFERSVSYAKENFLTFEFEDVVSCTDKVLEQIQFRFKVDFGNKIRDNVLKNSSETRIHHRASFIYNNLRPLDRILRSVLFGVV